MVPDIPAGKFDGIDTLPMFDIPMHAQSEPAQVAPAQASRAARPPIARAVCPQCRHAAVGLDADSGHLRYRTHDIYRTYGPSTACSASGQLVHDLAPRDGHLVLAQPRDGRGHRRPARCGCEGREAATNTARSTAESVGDEPAA